MDNPFPGMNPYLEGPKYWKGFHGLFIAALTAELNHTLPEPLVARYEQRLYVASWYRNIYPDAVVFFERPEGVSLPESSDSVQTQVVSASPVTPPLKFTVEDEKAREAFIEIVLPSDDDETSDEVIAVIEILSPANKEPETEGNDEYRRKQRAVLSSEAHLLEIDLLRGGEHTVAMRRGPIREQKPFDYVYCLHRAGVGPTYECMPFTLREPFPPLFVPLLEGMPDAVIDVSAAFARAWQDAAYGHFRYSRDPKPPLTETDAVWLDTLLREKGLRP